MVAVLALWKTGSAQTKETEPSQSLVTYLARSLENLDSSRANSPRPWGKTEHTGISAGFGWSGSSGPAGSGILSRYGLEALLGVCGGFVLL